MTLYSKRIKGTTKLEIFLRILIPVFRYQLLYRIEFYNIDIIAMFPNQVYQILCLQPDIVIRMISTIQIVIYLLLIHKIIKYQIRYKYRK